MWKPFQPLPNITSPYRLLLVGHIVSDRVPKDSLPVPTVWHIVPDRMSLYTIRTVANGPMQGCEATVW